MITWHLSEFNNLTAQQLRRNFSKAGAYFTSKLRLNVNTSQPYTKTKAGKYHGKNPSKPFAFPHKLSGQLIKSMTWNLDKDKFILTCGSNLKGYPAFLESGTKFMAQRPWLSGTWRQEQYAVGKMITG